MNAMSKSVNQTDVRRLAMDYLARREHSAEELSRKLRQRFGSNAEVIELIAQQIDRLVGEGLLSDERFAASVVRQLIERGFGPKRLDAELRARGVRDVWERCADAVELEVDWFDKARKVYQKKFGNALLPQEQKTRQKEWARRARFMQYRGFETEHFLGLLGSDVGESAFSDELSD